MKLIIVYLAVLIVSGIGSFEENKKPLKEAIMDIVDTNGDKNVTFDEFDRCYRGMSKLTHFLG